MNIIGKWKVRELLFPADGGTVSYTPDNLPEGDCADEIIMMLTNRIEFTEDGLMNTLMRVPEDKLELAKSQGAVIDEDGFAPIEQTTWKEENGKFFYDTKVEGEVLGETVDPFAEIPVDENGCASLEALKEAWGRKLLNSCFRHWKPLEIFSKQSTWKKNKYKHRYVKTK